MLKLDDEVDYCPDKTGWKDFWSIYLSLICCLAEDNSASFFILVSHRQWELPDHKCSLIGSRGSRRGGASRIESAESSSP